MPSAVPDAKVSWSSGTVFSKYDMPSLPTIAVDAPYPGLCDCVLVSVAVRVGVVLASALGTRQQQLQKQANQDSEFGFQQQQLSNANSRLAIQQQNADIRAEEAQANISLLQATEAQLKAAEIANEGITLEYDSGSTRTTLEVIQSTSLLLDARISFAKANRDFIISKFELAFQLGILSQKSLRAL